MVLTITLNGSGVRYILIIIAIWFFVNQSTLAISLAELNSSPTDNPYLSNFFALKAAVTTIHFARPFTFGMKNKKSKLTDMDCYYPYIRY